MKETIELDIICFFSHYHIQREYNLVRELTSIDKKDFSFYRIQDVATFREYMSLFID